MKCNWNHPIWQEIAEENYYQSMVSGKHIPHSNPINFHHKKSKGKFPELMYARENILFCTHQEHHLIEFGSKEQRIDYIKEFNGDVDCFFVNLLK